MARSNFLYYVSEKEKGDTINYVAILFKENV